MTISTTFKTRQRHFIVTREYDSPTTFYEKYRPKWWMLKEAIEDGKIATHCIDGRNRINVVEAIQVIWPDATYEINFQRRSAEVAMSKITLFDEAEETPAHNANME